MRPCRVSARRGRVLRSGPGQQTGRAPNALEQPDIEDTLYAAADRAGPAAGDGERQCWATIRSGLSAGLQEPIDLDARARWC